VEKIVRDATSAGAIVTRIRSLFKHTPPDRMAADVNEIITEVLHLMQDERDRHSISVVTDLNEDLPPVMVDKVQVQQVLTNLVQNGVDAMASVVSRPKSLVIRSFIEDNEMVTVEVRDCGTGIADREKMFEPFFTTKSKGLGVGLSVCRSIIESHGGRIWAMSGSDGDGASLAFTLPIAGEIRAALHSGDTEF
jgi:C4-dicarboxylate-specific signal transduction histidine kinase